MSNERRYFVLCEANCKFEGMTKEQILAAIAEATGATVTDIDNAFITKIKELNKGEALTFWRGTTAEYNALPEIYDDCYYIKTDDTTLVDMGADIENIKDELQTTVPIDKGGTGATDKATALVNLGVVDYITEEGTKTVTGGVWHYRKWRSGKAEAWYINNNAVEVAGQSYVGMSIPLPDGVFVIAPDFIQPSFVTNTDNANFGLCEIYATASDQTSEEIRVRISNGHTGKFLPNFIVYAVQLNITIVEA